LTRPSKQAGLEDADARICGFPQPCGQVAQLEFFSVSGTGRRKAGVVNFNVGQ
jgi:hypothetical protein